jgi:4-hydroxybenzoate polyprenyltransferase
MDTTLNQPPGLQTARVIAADIKLAHSIFALPFALLAAFMAATSAYATIDWNRFVVQLILVALAMVFGRTVAMVSNRFFDRHIDALNPRTAGRALPSGRLSREAALTSIALASAGFLLVCLGFYWISGNTWPIILAVPVLLWISLYPLAKRFTILCHVWLGTSLAMSPLAAALAIEPSALEIQPALWMIAAMVLTWVTGFDILYSLQDVEIDREQRLHSMPSCLGIQMSLWISRMLHGLAAGFLCLVFILDPRFHILFMLGVACTVAMLIWEHVLIARYGTTRITLAFFTLNGLVSCLLGLTGIVDVLIWNP